MRKRIVGSHQTQPGGQSDKGWLDLEQIATVEVTSEVSMHRIELRFHEVDCERRRSSSFVGRWKTGRERDEQETHVGDSRTATRL